LSLARVRERVQRGGHSIPEPVIRRRFLKGLHHLFHLYELYLNAWMIFDNSGAQPYLVADYDHGKMEIKNEELFVQIKKQAGTK
jgi:predicted ABC-type ATPase